MKSMLSISLTFTFNPFSIDTNSATNQRWRNCLALDIFQTTPKLSLYAWLFAQIFFLFHAFFPNDVRWGTLVSVFMCKIYAFALNLLCNWLWWFIRIQTLDKRKFAWICQFMNILSYYQRFLIGAMWYDMWQVCSLVPVYFFKSLYNVNLVWDWEDESRSQWVRP